MKSEINLLAPDIKAQRSRLVRIHRIWAIIDALLLCMLLITGSVGAAWWSLRDVSASLDQRIVSEASEYEALLLRLREMNGLLAAVDSRIQQSPGHTVLIADMVRGVPKGIGITKMELIEGKEAFTITGKATQGSVVIQYQDFLEKLVWVDHVVAPIQNFARSPEATFTFTVFITKATP
jgi:hypothetical protein